MRISCIVNPSISNLMHISTGAYIWSIFHWGGGGGREPDSENISNLFLFKNHVVNICNATLFATEFIYIQI
jgi:hypothetical protein